MSHNLEAIRAICIAYRRGAGRIVPTNLRRIHPGRLSLQWLSLPVVARFWTQAAERELPVHLRSKLGESGQVIGANCH